MDLNRLDHLAQMLADTNLRSRRGVPVALGAALVGAIAGLEPDAAEATPKRRRHPNHAKRHHSTRRAAHGPERHHAGTQEKHRKKPKNPGDGHDGGTDTPPPTDPPACVSDCAATTPCGDDGCHGSCGSCTGAETCQEGRCVCQPDCTGKTCGGDGCGGSCGGCAAHETCQGGSCVCQPQCDGKTCGPDGCGGSCGTCGAQEVCDGGTCLCTPNCGSKVCGGDGCGGSCGSCRDQGAATCGTTGACQGGACDLYASGTPCQAAVCTSETTLQPACTCDGQGGCDCPGPITCPHHLECHNGTCLSSCANHDDCATGYVCGANGTCTNVTSCDCSNLNFCSGLSHGVCTLECTCVCGEGWTGATCDTPANVPVLECSDHLTCLACNSDIAGGCVFCSVTFEGANDVCVIADQCASPRDGCHQ